MGPKERDGDEAKDEEMTSIHLIVGKVSREQWIIAASRYNTCRLGLLKTYKPNRVNLGTSGLPIYLQLRIKDFGNTSLTTKYFCSNVMISVAFKLIMRPTISV
jgi:hypothetical protein